MKLKYGKGFSLQELKDAGLTQTFAQTVGISVDYRRTDSNLATLKRNVQRLKNYKSKLILFPKKAGKPKNGEIADSTAEVLKSTDAKTQNSDKHLVEIAAPKKRQKQAKITAEMKAAKVYTKLRQERVTKHYWGRREKRQKEAEDAKK